MKSLIAASAVLLLLGGLVVAGCGDDDGGSTTGGADASGQEGESTGSSQSSNGQIEPTSETKAEFVAKADSLCRERLREIQASVREVIESPQGEGAQQAALSDIVTNAVVPGLEGEADELRELGAPKGDVKQVEEIITAIEAMVAEAREDPNKFVTQSEAFVKAQSLARAYGLDACGRAS